MTQGPLHIPRNPAATISATFQEVDDLFLFHLGAGLCRSLPASISLRVECSDCLGGVSSLRPGQRRWLTRVEAANLLRAARQSEKAARHLTAFILIGVYTGKRKEAILSLRWSQVDLHASVIDWERPNVPRTKKRRGRNPINPKLLGHLKRMRRFGSDLGPVVAYDGKPVKDVKKSFATACDRAGLCDVTPHTLRHTCATWLMKSGVPTWEAAGFLGMSEETLVRVYGHHHPEHQLQAATAF